MPATITASSHSRSPACTLKPASPNLNCLRLTERACDPAPNALAHDEHLTALAPAIELQRFFPHMAALLVRTRPVQAFALPSDQSLRIAHLVRPQQARQISTFEFQRIPLPSVFRVTLDQGRTSIAELVDHSPLRLAEDKLSLQDLALAKSPFEQDGGIDAELLQTIDESDTLSRKHAHH